MNVSETEDNKNHIYRSKLCQINQNFKNTLHQFFNSFYLIMSIIFQGKTIYFKASKLKDNNSMSKMINIHI